ncbi:MAG: NirD/YgiW/YdeI family stress tolerance protein [Lentisphaerota bacterium]
MKKLTLTLATLAITLGAYCTYADLVMPQDKQSPATITVTTIADAVNMANDSHIWLEGNLIKKNCKSCYTFKDSTGEIVVKICPKVWNKLDVTPDQKVRIYGEVEKSFFRYIGFSPNTKIEAKKIEIVTPPSTIDKIKQSFN